MSKYTFSTSGEAWVTSKITVDANSQEEAQQKADNGDGVREIVRVEYLSDAPFKHPEWLAMSPTNYEDLFGGSVCFEDDIYNHIFPEV